VLVGVDFVDRSGAVITHDSAVAEWLNPGATNYWSVAYSGVREFDTCHAKVIYSSEPGPPIIEDIEIP